MLPHQVYVKLRDKGTSFHDMTQGKNVVSDKVVMMHRTAHVSSFINGGQLIEVPEDEALAAIAKQEGTASVSSPAKKAEAVVAPEKKDPTASVDKKEATTIPAKKSAPVKSAIPEKKVADKKEVAPKKSNLTEE